ncbi:hypothetical protein GVAV_000902 [Gurleya vavrai]
MYTENIICSNICLYTTIAKNTDEHNFLRNKTIFCLNSIFFSISNFIKFKDHDIDKKILKHRNNSITKNNNINDNQFLFERLFNFEYMKSKDNSKYTHSYEKYDNKLYNTKLATLYEYNKNVIKINDLGMTKKSNNYKKMDIEKIHVIKIQNIQIIDNIINFKYVDYDFFICFFDHFSEANYMSRIQIKRNLHAGSIECFLSLINCLNYYFRNIEIEFEEPIQNEIKKWLIIFDDCKFAENKESIIPIFRLGLKILSDTFLFY